MLSPRILSSMLDRCRTCVAARGGHVDVTPYIDLNFMKYNGYLIYGSAYINTFIVSCGKMYCVYV